jgi:hypothetical protein
MSSWATLWHNVIDGENLAIDVDIANLFDARLPQG